MKNLYALAVMFFLFFGDAFSQKQTNIWYFGRSAGLDFNSGSPVPFHGQLSTAEGCASISDKNGNILFYTDGVTVFSSANTIMPNGAGLNGSTSSAQSAIIVPVPGSSTLYYVFTVDAEGGANGFCYSVVDMALNGGLGDVVVVNKNTQLFTPSAEKLTAVKHANGLYVWVIAHGFNDNNFYAYLVDCNGVHAPVISNVGQNEPYPGWGYMVTSPDGHRIARATSSLGFEVADFDNATGVVSNPVALGNTSGANECYGVSFSPDNNLLYGSKITDGSVWQWNLQAGSGPAIIASATQVGTAGGSALPYLGGALQLAVDGKLYFTEYYSTYVGAINSPNTIGAGCGFQNDAIDLNVGGGEGSVLGLPPFIQSYFDTVIAVIAYSGHCSNYPVNFNISGNTAYLDSAYWDFGDLSSGTQNNSNSLTPSHTYATGGTYNVTLIRYLACVADTNFAQLTIDSSYVANVYDTLCYGQSYSLPSGNIVNGTGTYSDTLSSVSGCDSIIVTHITTTPLATSTSYDTICQGQSYKRPSGVYADSAGTYMDTVQTTAGCDSIITTYLAINPISTTTLYDTICQGSIFTLPNGVGISLPGDYLLTLTNRFGCDSVVTIKLAVIDFTVNAQENDALCLGQNTGSIISTASQGSPPYTFYLISNGVPVDSNTSGSFDSIATGSYVVNATEGHGCSASTNIYVNQSSPTLLVLKVANLSCYDSHDGAIIIGATGGVPAYTFSLNHQIQNSTGIFSSLDSGEYNYFVTDARGCIAFGDTTITQPAQLIVTPSPDSAFVKLGDSVQLSATSNYDTSATYLWSPPVGLSCDTCKNPVVMIENSLVYKLVVSTGTGCSVVLEIPVTILPDYTLFVPNVFTPDGNGENDFFQIYGSLYLLKYVDVRIYNRIGQKVFESNDINFRWDGTFSGQKLPPSVFTYTINAVFIDNHSAKLLTGSLTLLR